MDQDESSVELLDRRIRQLAEGPPEQAIRDLTALANRAVIEIHKIAREQAKDRRGGADWGKWARLANAARSGVLQLASIRDSLKAFPAPDTDGPRA